MLEEPGEPRVPVRSHSEMGHGDNAPIVDKPFRGGSEPGASKIIRPGDRRQSPARGKDVFLLIVHAVMPLPG